MSEDNQWPLWEVFIQSKIHRVCCDCIACADTQIWQIVKGSCHREHRPAKIKKKCQLSAENSFLFNQFF